MEKKARRSDVSIYYSDSYHVTSELELQSDAVPSSDSNKQNDALLRIRRRETIRRGLRGVGWIRCASCGCECCRRVGSGLPAAARRHRPP